MVRRSIGLRFGALMSGALTVAFAGLVANVLNLGVSFLIARRLNPADYGAYSQLMGMFFIVALPGSALSVAVIRRATYYLVQQDDDLIHRWQRRLNHRILRLAIGFSLIALIGSLFIAQWLGHRSWVAVWVNTLAAITWAILNVDRALLQSRQRYSALASNFVLEGFARTMFMVLLSPFGVTGIVLGLLIGIGLTRLHARRLVATRRVDREGPELERTGITRDLLIALATLALLATLQFLDVLLVGRYQGAVAGSYSAISQVAKTLVYGAIILGSFLLPETALADRRGRDAYRQLGLAGGLLLVPATVLLGVSEAMPKWLLTTVFGARYASEWSSMTSLVLAMTFLAGSTLLATYLLGSGRRWPTAWLALTTFGGLWYLSLSHGRVIETVHRDLMLQIVVFLGLLAATLLPLKSIEETE